MLLSHEQLFINTVQDLRSKIRANTVYSLIRACGLCRHLVLDSPTLFQLANKKHKLQIRFRIKDFTDTPLSNDFKGSGGRNIFPYGKMDAITVKNEDFLQIKIHFYGKTEFTVKDLLHAACHYYGGIHAGAPDLKQEYLSKLNWPPHRETNISIWHMTTICRIILQAMKPLETAIKNTPFTGGFAPQS